MLRKAQSLGRGWLLAVPLIFMSGPAPAQQSGLPSPATIADRLTPNVAASRLLGAEVRGVNGESLGEIEDLLLAPGTGQMRYAVLALDGPLSITETRYALPIGKFSQARRGDHLVVDMPRVQIEAMRPLADAKSLRAVTAILGQDVFEPDGKRVGAIDDLAVDLPTGRITSVLLAIDRAWNPMARELKVPLHAVNLATRSERVFLRVPREQLLRIAEQPGSPRASGAAAAGTAAGALGGDASPNVPIRPTLRTWPPNAIIEQSR